MTDYQIKFYKRVLSSDGHPFSVLQRSILVSRSENAEDAVRRAQQQFEHLEGLRDWQLHADFVEACPEDHTSRRRKAA